MKIPGKIALAGLTALLFGCGHPVPPEKSAYIGEWEGKAFYLLITEDGSVQYKRVKNGVTTTINSPIKKFDGDNFEVGIGPMATTFFVSKPPYQDGENWKMVVDGAELIRADD